MIKVCLVDDQTLVRKGVRSLLELSDEIEVIAEAPDGLTGASIFLGGSFGSTVLGTANIMMAATLAKGRTVIESAACEPEIADLAHCLNDMGAHITGIGSPRLVIEGVRQLHPVEYTVIPDRIEAGTLMVAASITGGNILLKNCPVKVMGSTIEKLHEAGLIIEEETGGVRVKGNGNLKPVQIITNPYPGFPTDMQAQLMTFLALADNTSVISERIFENRFMHVAELRRLGAKIRVTGGKAVVRGVEHLSGTTVMATDLRASASLVLAGLMANGETVVRRIYHLDRGYERIGRKLRGAGARIERFAE